MELDENSSASSSFFEPCPAHLLMVPDDEHDQESRTKYQEFKSVNPIFRRPIDCARNMISYYSSFCLGCAIHSENYILDGLWKGLRPSPQQFDMTVPFEDLFECNEPEFGTPELVEAKRGREFPHMKAMVLLLSFLGPQHARVIEAYFDGSSVVMRPTRLFDLREKDETLIRTFAQWFLGEPTGETRVLPGV
ncbi:uncharacterized protein BO72DRAFT_527565 [Aspergillus fijiensis CBS 313.89]|uniref:Uncharacterized protein n=1 Tax=Aspergillus fijiensis CBS 313.89 TaxID=1448319 RepID=A0A8G1VY47_9EURO|nr:uncharacterized protein BO72DRAFT_527565 [Aspergillus fijiensis CBS 313.89]RAK77370.1 hypothetical protein BO72DRAFT_527565 [Aspergillus fijiensis CBS 313.89]